MALAHLKNHLGVELAGAGEGHHTAVNHKGGRGALQAGQFGLVVDQGDDAPVADGHDALADELGGLGVHVLEVLLTPDV